MYFRVALRQEGLCALLLEVHKLSMKSFIRNQNLCEAVETEL